MIFYSSGNQQDVSRFEEEFLVDKNEVRNSKVCECDTCRRIKANHLRPAVNLQPLNIPE
jgi:hypothetical protein